jgi:hypothetical protein
VLTYGAAKAAPLQKQNQVSGGFGVGWTFFEGDIYLVA